MTSIVPHADAAETWWHEMPALGLAQVLELSPLHRHTTPDHTLEVWEHATYGRVLTVDGILRLATAEPALPEMWVHVPLASRLRESTSVLIRGAASGLLPEVLRHPGVNRVVVVESEPSIVELLVTWFGHASAFADPRVEVLVAPPAGSERFDVMLLDPLSGDPLWVDGLAASLAEDGVAVEPHRVFLTVRGPRLHPVPDRGSIRAWLERGRIPGLSVYTACTPLTPGGLSVFLVGSPSGRSLARPERSFTGRHYTPGVHEGAFALPAWLRGLPLDVGGETAAGRPESWWHEQVMGSGVSQALALRPLQRVEGAFQVIEVHDHASFGRVLVLDGTVQNSVADEFVNRELSVHVPLLGRFREEASVLVLGGGDGGVLREALRHPWVRRVVVAEIDRAVVEVSNRWFPLAGNEPDPRAEIVIRDAAEYLEELVEAGETFDVIVIDATDSTRPSQSLWNDAFYDRLSRCLTKDGVCLDSDTLVAGNRPRLSRDWHGEPLRDVQRAGRFFAHRQCFVSRMPLYPGGYHVFFLYSNDAHSYATPERNYVGRHYTPEVHAACFALPAWLQRLVETQFAEPAVGEAKAATASLAAF